MRLESKIETMSGDQAVSWCAQKAKANPRLVKTITIAKSEPVKEEKQQE